MLFVMSCNAQNAKRHVHRCARAEMDVCVHVCSYTVLFCYAHFNSGVLHITVGI